MGCGRNILLSNMGRKFYVTIPAESNIFKSSATACQVITFVPKTFIGADSFKELVKESNFFVDKSLLISEFLNDNSKKVGESHQYGYDKDLLELEVDEEGDPLSSEERLNKEIFESGKLKNGQKVALNIWNEKDIVKKYFGYYPVISISFKDITGSNYEELYCEPNSTQLLDSEKLKLSKYFLDQIFILIDDYDNPINHAILNFKYQDDIDKTVALFTDLFGQTLKGNRYLKKGLLTDDILYGVDASSTYGLATKKYSKFYGFTEYEIKELFYNYNINIDLAKDIKDFYGGYNLNGDEVYNPWSVLKCLDTFQYYININNDQDTIDIKNDILQRYWIENQNLDFINSLFKIDDISSVINSLLRNESNRFHLKKSISISDLKKFERFLDLGSSMYNHTLTNKNSVCLILSILFFEGYLTPRNISKQSEKYDENGRIYIKFPNNEISKALGSNCERK
eukprot:gene1274-2460_t